MYKKVNITENGLQIISLFTHGFDKVYYIREIERLLKISPRTAQLILEDLESKGILKSMIRGKIKTYELIMNETSKKYLLLVEHYKAITFLEQNLLLKEIIEKISPSINGIGIIFGSHVKGIAKKDSDLDLFVVGSYSKDEIKKNSKIYGLEISVKCYPESIFRKNLNRDIFIKEILKNHVVFKGAEKFISEVIKNE
jgi:predicted nucleotidyltransferase